MFYFSVYKRKERGEEEEKGEKLAKLFSGRYERENSTPENITLLGVDCLLDVV